MRSSKVVVSSSLSTNLLKTDEQPALQNQKNARVEVAVGVNPQPPPCASFTAACCCGAEQIGNMVIIRGAGEESGKFQQNEDGRIAVKYIVGPFWPVMVFITVPLIIGIPLLVGVWTLAFTSMPVGVVLGLLLGLATTAVVLALLSVACKDPGLMPRYRERPPGYDEWVFSDQAETYRFKSTPIPALFPHLLNFFPSNRPRHAKYCKDCDVVILGYDHVCPWTGTGIGARNMENFVRFSQSICALVLYVVALVIFGFFSVSKYESNKP
jgi:hypothetical protein